MNEPAYIKLARERLHAAQRMIENIDEPTPADRERIRLAGRALPEALREHVSYHDHGSRKPPARGICYADRDSVRHHGVKRRANLTLVLVHQTQAVHAGRILYFDLVRFRGAGHQARTLRHSGGVFGFWVTSYRYSSEVSRSESGLQCR
jgi:hypothetical protein